MWFFKRRLRARFEPADPNSWHDSAGILMVQHARTEADCQHLEALWLAGWRPPPRQWIDVPTEAATVWLAGHHPIII